MIQVCSPNAGTSWAKLPAGRKKQKAFLLSLTKEGRERSLRNRADRRIPDGVQFVCLVGTSSGVGDGVVLTRSQWSEDLQRQGVPAVPLPLNHGAVMRTVRAAETLLELVRYDQPRWAATKVVALRKELFER